MKQLLVIGILSLLWTCEVTAVAYTNSFPLKSTPGVYKGLKWVNVTAMDAGDQQIYTDCVAAASGKTYGITLNGTDPNSPTPGQPTVMTAQFPGSKTKSFSLTSFYGACAEPAQTFNHGTVQPIFVVAVNCTWVVHGYKEANGAFRPGGAKPSVTKRFFYRPLNACPAGGAPMTKYSLPSSWTDLRLVTFNYTSTAVSMIDNQTFTGTNYLGGALGFLDDVVYNTQI